MRSRALVVGALVLLVGCSTDKRPAVAPASSSDASTTAATATTLVATTAPPTTVSPLAPIAGCPDPGPLARPDPNRPIYGANATVDVAGSRVTGSVAIQFTPDLPTDELVLRLWPNAPVLAASGVMEDVGAITSGQGAALAVDRPDSTTVHVALPSTLTPGTKFTFTVPFTLTVPAGNADRVAHEGDTMRLGSFLPLLAWEPGVGWATDPPTTAHAEAATSPVADYDIALTVPAGYDVLGTGVHGADNHWRATAVRDAAFSIGHFNELDQDVDGVHITVGVDKSVAEDPARYMNLIAHAMRDYQSRLSAYPWSTYTAVVLPGFHGGIEFPTHVMHGAGSTDRSIVHELAHQWFYSLVGNDQGRDPWLDEGLASYVEFVEVASLARHEGETIPPAARGHAGDPMTFWDHHEPSYYEGVYVQSAVAVARLGTVDEVDCALRQYVAGKAFTIATSADLFHSLTTMFPDAVARLAPYGLHP